jgi:predicted secreted protein
MPHVDFVLFAGSPMANRQKETERKESFGTAEAAPFRSRAFQIFELRRHSEDALLLYVDMP